MRVKLDYNHFLQQIDEVLSVSRSKVAKENALGISYGLQLLSCYIRQIAERALELDDDVLVGLLLDLHVLKEEGEG